MMWVVLWPSGMVDAFCPPPSSTRPMNPWGAKNLCSERHVFCCTPPAVEPTSRPQTLTAPGHSPVNGA